MAPRSHTVSRSLTPAPAPLPLPHVGLAFGLWLYHSLLFVSHGRAGSTVSRPFSLLQRQIIALAHDSHCQRCPFLLLVRGSPSLLPNRQSPRTPLHYFCALFSFRMSVSVSGSGWPSVVSVHLQPRTLPASETHRYPGTTAVLVVRQAMGCR